VIVRVLTVASLLGLLLAGLARGAPLATQESEDATVVLVGDIPGMTELADTLVELLERQKVRPHVVRAPGFDPETVISGGQQDESVSAFVVPETTTSAQLYFRGPRAKRFLLRGLPLRNGLDEYGRELIAQVVESSVLALLHSNAGMTREQASVELAHAPDAARTDAVTAPKTDATAAALTDATSSRTPGVAARARPASDWRGWVAIRYALEWSGSDLGAAHGPGLETGLEWAALRTRVTAERWFPQNIASPELSASVQTTALRLVVDARWPRRTTHALVAGFGAGVDILSAQPTASHDPALTLAPERSHAVPVLRTELGYQLRADPWRVMALAFVDGSLLDTNYDLERADSAVRVATPWSWRPGVALVLGWAPALGGP
jgi:hypothetical protein